MEKTFAIICFIAFLQLLSPKLGSATFKNEMLRKSQIYSGKEITSNKITNPSSAAHYKPAAPCDPVTDMDGNVYHVIKIGKQCWMKENLKTAHFRDGFAITEMEYNNDWPLTGNHGDHAKTGRAAWCYYERNKQNDYTYGKLYNWYAVTDSRNLCPTGWHVPSDEEFQLLSDFLGGDDSSGAHMKAIKLWGEKDGKCADNTSGFTALPAGIRYTNGSFGRTGSDGADFWSSSDYRRTTSLSRILYYGGPNLGRHDFDKRTGLSVRCVGD